MNKLFQFIAHRGNTAGKNVALENSPEYILDALSLGFDVEVDVWYHEGALYLGHDGPQHHIGLTPATLDFLSDRRVWCHAKSIETLHVLLELKTVHCFFHKDDDVTLTSRGYVWTCPGRELGVRSICVMPELVCNKDTSLLRCAGICSDTIEEYRRLYHDVI